MWLKIDDSQGHIKNLEKLIGKCSDTLESELKTQKREPKEEWVHLFPLCHTYAPGTFLCTLTMVSCPWLWALQELNPLPIIGFLHSLPMGKSGGWKGEYLHLTPRGSERPIVLVMETVFLLTRLVMITNIQCLHNWEKWAIVGWGRKPYSGPALQVSSSLSTGTCCGSVHMTGDSGQRMLSMVLRVMWKVSMVKICSSREEITVQV